MITKASTLIAAITTTVALSLGSAAWAETDTIPTMEKFIAGIQDTELILGGYIFGDKSGNHSFFTEGASFSAAVSVESGKEDKTFIRSHCSPTGYLYSPETTCRFKAKGYLNVYENKLSYTITEFIFLYEPGL